ncbi:MAG: hypothetical protein H7838_00865 [Magnetococcus sp. DMHC-8]
MAVVHWQQPPTAAALHREWMDNLGRAETCSHQALVDRLLEELQGAPSGAFYALLGLQRWQVLKRRRLAHYHPALQVLVWQEALVSAQPLYAARLGRLLRHRWSVRRPSDRRRLATIDRQLALFDVLTDNLTGEGFLSVALHVVQQVMGRVQQHPTYIILAVQLADHLDNRFETRVAQFRQVTIVP